MWCRAAPSRQAGAALPRSRVGGLPIPPAAHRRATMTRDMGRVDTPALRGTWLGALLRVLSPVMRLVLASRLHWPLSRWFALLSWSGPRTGRAHTIPVSYVTDDGAVYVTTGDRWWRNVDGQAVRVRLAGHWYEGRATAIKDPAESLAEHDRRFQERPFFRRLAGIPGAGRGADLSALERAIAAGRTLIRIALA
jgi:hypothetical protein